jgi:hypothetical protein
MDKSPIDTIVPHGQLDPGMRLIGKPATYAELATEVRRMLDGHR